MQLHAEHGLPALTIGLAGVTVHLHTIHYRPFSYALTGPVMRPEIVWGEDADLSEMRCHRRVWQAGDEPRNDWPAFVGFQHYRRAFLIPALMPPNDPLSRRVHLDPWAQFITASPDWFTHYIEALDEVAEPAWIEWLNHVDLVVPRPLMLGESMADHYRKMHRAEDWEIWAHLMRAEGLDDRLPYLTAFNSFIARPYLFDDYMRLWTRVIDAARPLIAPSPRVFGYLSERLFTAWLHAVRCERPWLRIVTLPVLFCPEMT